MNPKYHLPSLLPGSGKLLAAVPASRTRGSHFKSLALALALGAGGAQAQTILEVGGAATIADEVLTTGDVPAAGVNWTVDGNIGAGIKFSGLVSPTVAVANTGSVTLTFNHRYDFEATGDPWDGGAVFVSVNGGAFTYVPLASFSSNGYVGPTTANKDSAWEAGGEDVFYGQSAGYGTPALITSVADLGTLNATDTVAVEFRGGWDGAELKGPPAWEIGSVSISDTGGPLLDVNFSADSTSGFTVVNTGTVTGPWTYVKPINHFEIDGDLLTSDRYAPVSVGSVIDLNGAKLSVTLLTGTLDAADSFTLFDLSGGTTLTGNIESISLPPGTWDISALETTGVITLIAPPVGPAFITSANVGAGGDTWNSLANWDTGALPAGTDGAIIQTGLTARADSAATPAAYTGGLFLEANSAVRIGGGGSSSGRAQSRFALGTGTIEMQAGSQIQWQMNSPNFQFPNLDLQGDATIAMASNESHNKSYFINGVSGSGELTVAGANGCTYIFEDANPSWSGGLIGKLNSNLRVSVRGQAVGCFGTGDVEIQDKTELYIQNNNAGAGDTIDDAATLTLTGTGRDQSLALKLQMNGSETVGFLVRDGFPYPAGTYGRVGLGGVDYEQSWIGGDSILTVDSEPADVTAPTVSFADNKTGGPISESETVIYTVTFSEPVTGVDATDFENSAATTPSPITINSVSATADSSVYTVSVSMVFPGDAGNLQLGLAAGTNITDLFGNAAVVSADDTTLVVNTDSAALVANINGPVATTGPIYGLPTIPYTVSFAKFWIDDATVTAADFTNAGSATITVGAVTRISGPTEPAVYAFDVTPTSSGTVQLQITGTISDTIPNTLVTPVVDDFTYTLSAGPEPAKETITVDSVLDISLRYVTGFIKTFTFDASGSDKLVVIGTGEHNFGGNLSGKIKTVTYDGVSLTKAVEQLPTLSNLQTTSSLWYLDDPGSVHTAGQIVMTVEGNGTNYVQTAFAMSGTAPGFGGGSAIAIASPDVDMLVSSPNSTVISWLTLGGAGNTASTAESVLADSPAGVITFGSKRQSSNYAGHALGESTGLTVATTGFEWNTGLTDTLSLAAEFLAADAPVTGNTYATWVSGFTLTDVTIDGDDDGDGLANVIEAFFGTDPSISNAGLAEVGKSGNTVTFTHPNPDAIDVVTDVTGSYEWSLDLATWYLDDGVDGTAGTTVTTVATADSPTDNTTSVVATIGGTVPEKLFLRVRATQP